MRIIRLSESRRIKIRNIIKNRKTTSEFSSTFQLQHVRVQLFLSSR